MKVASAAISGVMPADSSTASGGVYGCLHFVQTTRTKRCARTAITLLATRYAGTPMSIMRVIAPGASFVCSVLKTKCPVKDA